MKKSVVFLLSALAVLTGCHYEESFQEDSLNGFDVTLESIVSDSETRTYADEQHLVVWHNDDRVSVFEKKEYWEEYKYIGRTGTVGGKLTKVTSEGSGTGGDLDYYYAVYPHSELNGFNNQGHLLLTLPHEQSYDEFSFGRGTNLMVSASEDNNFRFKNIGGYLVFKLYGEGVSVSSIRLTGNNNEEITGDVDVVISPGADPITTMSTARYAVKYDDAVLVCDPAVPLGATASDYKEFWFVLPPMTFTGGFSIEVTTSDGDVWTKTTNNPKTITRNHYSPISAMEVAVEHTQPNNVIYYTSTDGNIVTPQIGGSTYTSIFGTSLVSNKYVDGMGIIEFRGPVTTIGYRAFMDCSRLTSIVIPESVASIGNQAFSGCSGLTGELVLPSSLSTIGLLAFQNCSGITGGLVIPEGVISIGASAFSGCSGFSGELTLPSSLTTIDISAFNDCSGFIGELSLPKSLTSIGGYAFANCSGFTGGLAIPSGLTTIDNHVFMNCSGLTGNLTIPEGVTSIGMSAFFGCSGFTELTLPSSLTTIDRTAFYGCSNLSSIVVVADNPPVLGATNVFDRTNDCPIYVPTGSVDAYKSAWSSYADRIHAIPPEAVDLGLSVKWAAFNVGASVPEEFGSYFSWAETETKSTYWTDNYKFNYSVYSPSGFTKYNETDGLKTLELSDDAAYVNWGTEWRMPTIDEMKELKNSSNCDWEWTTLNGVNGYRVSSKKEGYIGNSIFLPAGGFYGLENNYLGVRGYYWSSSGYVAGTTSSSTGRQGYGYILFFKDSSAEAGWNVESRYLGLLVRPVRQ